uniref:Post-GPI attachment to proteins factor 3 n=2 Tax=Hemiselmis andersenii TaxID=464988 RepID=A0A7S0UDC5_HEMAN|mmetsp:Transcript_5982/g.13927  ORF Transcript_5982/g.13927 Transcript_5982/m.13927 type:complete len:198 (+) Transcript_5982:3-596(+)
MVGEGLGRGYELFEFVGRMLPTAFFKQLGTPHKTPGWVALFLLSNIAFPIAGIKILTSRREEKPNKMLAIFVFLVGIVSTTFHWNQCCLGSGSPVVHTWCLVDTTFSCVSGLVYIIHSWGTIRKRICALFAIAVMFLFDTSRFYTITHSIWHIMSAFVAYRLVRDRETFEQQRRISEGKQRVRGMQMGLIIDESVSA